MMPNTSLFVLSGLGVGLAIASSLVEPRPILVWNATASAPRGLYCIATPNGLQAGDLVLVQPDPASAAVYAERGYLSLAVPLLKRVGALGGMRVCEHGGDVTIEGRHVANALPIDGRGRPMTSWSGCRALSDGEFFALNADVPSSLDGRYFGPSLPSSVIGRAIPVWTEKSAERGFNQPSPMCCSVRSDAAVPLSRPCRPIRRAQRISRPAAWPLRFGVV